MPPASANRFACWTKAGRRHERGQDVVVGAIQPKTSHEIECVLSKLEVIPLREVDGVSVMDTPAILKRHPAVCLVDGLAYDNPPGSPHASRWEDVNELLDAGISVISSINIQYIDDLQERVARITGKSVKQTVPRSFLNSADEIVVVDAPPEMCIARRDGQIGGARPARRKSSPNCAKSRCCWRPMWWTGSSKPTCSATASRKPSAPRSAFWFASRRAPTPRP